MQANEFVFHNEGETRYTNINVINRNDRMTFGSLAHDFGLNPLVQATGENYTTLYYHAHSQRDPTNWGWWKMESL